MEEKKKDYFLPISIILAAVLIAGSLIYSAGKKSTPSDNPLAGNSAENLSLENPDVSQAIWQGNPSAPVSIVEYSDFQCPVCADFFQNIFPSLKRDYIDTGKVKFTQLDFPFLGRESLATASAARCAADQKKFWEFHDLIYQAEILDGQENNGNLTEDFLIGLGNQLNLNSSVFQSCLSSGEHDQDVLNSASQGQRAGVRATPTFFINGQKMQGLYPADPYGSMKLIIESELKNK